MPPPCRLYERYILCCACADSHSLARASSYSRAVALKIWRDLLWGPAKRIVINFLFSNKQKLDFFLNTISRKVYFFCVKLFPHQKDTLSFDTTESLVANIFVSELWFFEEKNSFFLQKRRLHNEYQLYMFNVYGITMYSCPLRFQPRNYRPLRGHIETTLDKKFLFSKLDGLGIQQALFFENWFSDSSRTRNLGVVFCWSASWSDLFVFKLWIKHKFLIKVLYLFIGI